MYLTDLYLAWLKKSQKDKHKQTIQLKPGGRGGWVVLGFWEIHLAEESLHATGPQLESAIACPFGSRKATNLGDAWVFHPVVGWGPVDGGSEHS